ncbi:hypothetical protein [Spiroplasma endosymbiont of Aleiodes alternator]|uniref:hypothetical protein n=1 Tax=Spiroplasma endosymbiont of Aleiodes alternator TaxID=3139329 RepID=UPI003CCB3787
MEAKFKIDPWVTDQEPTDSNKKLTFDKLENYIRSIRTSHYKLGLVEQRISISGDQLNKILIDNENKTIKFDIFLFWMYKTEDGKFVKDSNFSISATIKYQVK